MKQSIIIGLCILAAAAVWRIGGTLNSDAIAMAVGVVLGIWAGVAVGLLVLVGERRRSTQPERREYRKRDYQLIADGEEKCKTVIVIRGVDDTPGSISHGLAVDRVDRPMNM